MRIRKYEMKAEGEKERGSLEPGWERKATAKIWITGRRRRRRRPEEKIR